MSKKRIQYTEDAQNDLDALLFLSAERWGTEHMERRRARLFAVFDFIAENPGIGQIHSHESGEFRRFFAHPHYIYYRSTPKTVIIARVVHQNQEPLNKHSL